MHLCASSWMSPLSSCLSCPGILPSKCTKKMDVNHVVRYCTWVLCFFQNEKKIGMWLMGSPCLKYSTGWGDWISTSDEQVWVLSVALTHTNGRRMMGNLSCICLKTEHSSADRFECIGRSSETSVSLDGHSGGFCCHVLHLHSSPAMLTTLLTAQGVCVF